MPRTGKGEVRFSGGFWRARVTLKGKNRLDVVLPTCQSEEEAIERAAVLSAQALRLRRAGKVETASARALLEELAAATDPKDALTVIGELCGVKGDPLAEANAKAAQTAPTFKDVAKLWTDGDLHRDYPDHVKAKDSELDESRLEKLCAIDVGGIKLGDVSIDKFTLEHAERAMRQLPKEAKRPATRRQYAQLIHRVTALAVYPCRIIKASPLPRGFLPKVGKPPAYSFLYPDEDAKLMGCSGPDGVALARRLLYGFLSREGCRRGEAAGLTWADLDLQKGSVKLDKNKTDEPRAWALDAGVTRALKAWKESLKPALDALVFVAEDVSHLSNLLRADLSSAGVDRVELHRSGERRGRLRAHDLRGTFVTLSLANGKSETWVADRTGHKSSQMINRYRRSARSAAELNLGSLVPLDQALPEFRGPSIAHGSPTEPNEGDQRTASKYSEVHEEGLEPPRVAPPEPKCEIGSGNPAKYANSGSTSATSCDLGTSNGPSRGQSNDADPVEAALGYAITKATEAGEWSVVLKLAAELEARRKARAAVVDLDAERAKRGR